MLRRLPISWRNRHNTTCDPPAPMEGAATHEATLCESVHLRRAEQSSNSAERVLHKAAQAKLLITCQGLQPPEPCSHSCGSALLVSPAAEHERYAVSNKKGPVHVSVKRSTSFAAKSSSKVEADSSEVIASQQNLLNILLTCQYTTSLCLTLCTKGRAGWVAPARKISRASISRPCVSTPKRRSPTLRPDFPTARRLMRHTGFDVLPLLQANIPSFTKQRRWNKLAGTLKTPV